MFRSTNGDRACSAIPQSNSPHPCSHAARPAHASAAALWAPLARFIAVEARIGEWAERRRTTAFAYEFLRFGIKQGWACLFGGAMVALIIATALWYPRGASLAR